MKTHTAPLPGLPFRTLLLPILLGTTLLSLCNPLTPVAHAQATPEDIIILLSSDGALTAAGWQGELGFVSYLNDNMPGRSLSRIGIIQYATTVATRYNLTDSQTPSAIDTELNNLSYNQGNTSTLDATQAAVNMFNAQSASLNPKLIILFADHSPNPSSTEDLTPAIGATLTGDNIPFVVYGMGEVFNPTPFSTTANNTGGAVYNNGGVIFSGTAAGQAAAAQFLTNAAPYFDQGVPEPDATALLAASSILAAGACRWRQRGKS